MSLKKVAALLFAMGAAINVSAAVVTTNVYSGFNSGGDGAPFSDLVGTLETDGISFGSDTGDNWHPFGLVAFGSQSLAQFVVGAEGDYTFALRSDDGSAAYIDDILVIDNGDGHGPTTLQGTAHLTAGVHSLKVNFFEDYNGESALDFTLATGARYIDSAVQVPEPLSLALVGTGLAGLGLARRRRA